MNRIDLLENWKQENMSLPIRELIASTKLVLFDFDGPICKLLQTFAAGQIVDPIKRLLLQHHYLTAGDLAEEDSHKIYRRVVDLLQTEHEPLFGQLEELLKNIECLGAQTAMRTDLYRWFVDFLLDRDIQIAITTNNSPKAVKTFLQRPDENSYHLFKGKIFGRTEKHFDKLKPHPSILQEALENLDVAPENTLMIGDAPTDAIAAREAGTAFLGYAESIKQYMQFVDVGVSIVIPSYTWIFESFEVGYPENLVMLDQVMKYR